MRDPRDSLDLRLGGSPGSAYSDAAAGGVPTGRPYLQLLFRCGGKYARAYRNADGTGYFARCPTCGKSVRFRVGEGGTSERFFEVHC